MLRDRLLEIDGSLGKIRISSRQPQRKREIRSMAMLPISVSLWVLLHYIIIVMTNGHLVKKSVLREATEKSQPPMMIVRQNMYGRN